MSGWMDRKTPGWFPGLHDPGSVMCVCGHRRCDHIESSPMRPCGTATFCQHEPCSCEAFVTAPVTAKGTVIQRWHVTGVGKRVGCHLYLHRDYARQAIRQIRLHGMGAIATRLDLNLDHQAKNYSGFKFNCVRFNLDNNHGGEVRFDEAPDFDTAREPRVGRWLVCFYDGYERSGESNALWHHKWAWIQDGFRGVSVRDSIAWSAKYLPLIAGAPKASARTWAAQLKEAGLA